MFLILGLILIDMEKNLEEHQSPGEEIQILLNSFTLIYTRVLKISHIHLAYLSSPQA